MAERINIGKFINNLDTEDLTSEKLQGVVNNVYAKAISTHKKLRAHTEEETKEQNDETIKFIKSNHDRLKASDEKVAKEINEAVEVNEATQVKEIDDRDLWKQINEFLDDTVGEGAGWITVNYLKDSLWYDKKIDVAYEELMDTLRKHHVELQRIAYEYVVNVTGVPEDEIAAELGESVNEAVIEKQLSEDELKNVVRNYLEEDVAAGAGWIELEWLCDSLYYAYNIKTTHNELRDVLGSIGYLPIKIGASEVVVVTNDVSLEDIAKELGESVEKVEKKPLTEAKNGEVLLSSPDFDLVVRTGVGRENTPYEALDVINKGPAKKHVVDVRLNLANWPRYEGKPVKHIYKNSYVSHGMRGSSDTLDDTREYIEVLQEAIKFAEQVNDFLSTSEWGDGHVEESLKESTEKKTELVEERAEESPNSIENVRAVARNLKKRMQQDPSLVNDNRLIKFKTGKSWIDYYYIEIDIFRTLYDEVEFTHEDVEKLYDMAVEELEKNHVTSKPNVERYEHTLRVRLWSDTLTPYGKWEPNNVKQLRSDAEKADSFLVNGKSTTELPFEWASVQSISHSRANDNYRITLKDGAKWNWSESSNQGKLTILLDQTESSNSEKLSEAKKTRVESLREEEKSSDTAFDAATLKAIKLKLRRATREAGKQGKLWINGEPAEDAPFSMWQVVDLEDFGADSYDLVLKDGSKWDWTDMGDKVLVNALPVTEIAEEVADEQPVEIATKVTWESAPARRGRPHINHSIIRGANLLDVVKKLAGMLHFYLTVDDIEAENLTAEQVLDNIKEHNGEGFDVIYSIRDADTGETYFDIAEEVEVECLKEHMDAGENEDVKDIDEVKVEE